LTKNEILRFVMTTRSDEDADVAWAIQELSDSVFRAPGSVSVRSLARRLGVEAGEEGVTTLMGLVQRQNGRFPRVGDRATLGDYGLSVQSETEDGWLVEIERVDNQQGDA